ncbi:MAG: hypothetical protein JJV98_13245, partial [Desulfosarcina sp.]|nr:hypothetical protein [Desulfobacterales bacterium]
MTLSILSRRVLQGIGFGALLLIMVALPLGAATTDPSKKGDSKVPADLVYRNGFVYTVDMTRSRAEAFAVKDGKFLAVGTNKDMKAFTGKDTKVIDLKGRMVM